MTEPLVRAGLDRRRFVAWASALGLTGTALPAHLWAAAERGPITKQVLAEAEKLAGLEFTDAERELMLEGLAELQEDYAAIRAVPLPNSVAPAFRFDPVVAEPPPPAELPRARRTMPPERQPAELSDEDLAFQPITRLAELVAAGRVSSSRLTGVYLDRLAALDPLLEAVITTTRELALEQADRADRELAAGRRRGPLHGIPWGAKDLLATRGYPTTWGATPFKDQRIEQDATVVTRLAEAGAVLVAKLTLGALAWGDVWFGGTTRNPWNLEQGSSGSSAGPAAATAAAMVGFSIGSETWGSIVSPSTRCGTTGLRPTFGAVSRHGAMALSWSMDKLGPICRSVEDCALVYDAIRGADGQDRSAVEAPFDWRPDRDPTALKLGYVPALFEREPEEEQAEWHANDLAVLDTLRDLGFELVPIELPELPVSALSLILSCEAAAAFDELTRSNRDDLLVRQIARAWPNEFRVARTIPAVEYIQASRVRTLLLERMAELMAQVDLYISPTYGGNNLLATNLSGHPQVVLPNGFRSDGTPTSITFTGRLFGEAHLLLAARAYQEATGFHLRRPPMTPPQPAEGGGEGGPR